MGEVVELACSGDRERCMDPHYCHGNGICCLGPTPTEKNCICFPRFTGKFCQRRSRLTENSEEALRRTELIAAFSAILGVIVILLFVALIFLQVKYYRNRKKRRAEGEHEMDRIPKPNDSDSRRILRNEPGYSWRESVRHSSKAYLKLTGPSSRSVPEDLFKMGMKIALFGMKEGEEKKNADALGRCFSADASSGRGGGGGGGGEITPFRYSKLQETKKDENNEKRVSGQKMEEDSVG